MFETQATPSSIPDLIDVSAKPRRYIFFVYFFYLLEFSHQPDTVSDSRFSRNFSRRLNPVSQAPLESGDFLSVESEIKKLSQTLSSQGILNLI